MIKMLLRLYGGELLSGFVKISETYLAKGLKMPIEEVVKILQHLHELQVLLYQPAKDKPQVTFVLPRQDADLLPLNVKRLENRKKLILDKMKSVIAYATTNQRCRMQIIQDYFGEVTYKPCGICDVCIANRKSENLHEVKDLREEMLTILKEKSLTVEQLEERIAPRDQEVFVDVIREMVDEGLLEYDTVWKLGLKKQKK